jgi:ribosomal protein S18 acetylase RimI-like enzyme
MSAGLSPAEVSVREAELHAMPLWVGTEAVDLGQWVLRTVPHAPGLKLRRTNSCLAIGDPGLRLGEAVESVRAFYVDRGREPLVQVEAGSDIEHALVDQGWHDLPVARAPFQVASVAVALAAAGATDVVETKVEGTRIRAVASVAGREAGRARAELNGGWLGVHGLEVEAALRRRGLARALMAAVFRVGATHGATTAWLEVAATNEPALRLYAGLGFQEHHTCRYLTGSG